MLDIVSYTNGSTILLLIRLYKEQIFSSENSTTAHPELAIERGKVPIKRSIGKTSAKKKPDFLIEDIVSVDFSINRCAI